MELTATTQAASLGQKGETTSRKASILIYEDETVYDQAIVASLRDTVHTVQVTDDFEPTLTAFEGRSPIDLLLADIAVPGGLDGTALARMVRIGGPIYAKASSVQATEVDDALGSD